jgi:hypothetical protein
VVDETSYRVLMNVMEDHHILDEKVSGMWCADWGRVELLLIVGRNPEAGRPPRAAGNGVHLHLDARRVHREVLDLGLCAAETEIHWGAPAVDFWYVLYGQTCGGGELMKGACVKSYLRTFET